MNGESWVYDFKFNFSLIYLIENFEKFLWEMYDRCKLVLHSHPVKTYHIIAYQ